MSVGDHTIKLCDTSETWIFPRNFCSVDGKGLAYGVMNLLSCTNSRRLHSDLISVNVEDANETACVKEEIKNVKYSFAVITLCLLY